jgi:excisionase family DNA binding protein
MTTDQAAVTLGLARVTVRRQIVNGRLRATKHGRDWWIEDDEVERYRRDILGRKGRQGGIRAGRAGSEVGGESVEP